MTMTFSLEHMAAGLWIYLKADLAQFLLERAWTRTLQGGSEVKPWPWADTWPVARLSVPKHDMDLIVLAGINGRTLAFGPGLLRVGDGGRENGGPNEGVSGMTVLAGHRDTHFRFLSELEIGDRLFLHQAGIGPLPYRVRDVQIVDSRAARIYQDPDGSSLVLVTCYPFDSVMPGGPLRYVVRAEAIEESA